MYTQEEVIHLTKAVAEGLTGRKIPRYLIEKAVVKAIQTDPPRYGFEFHPATGDWRKENSSGDKVRVIHRPTTQKILEIFLPAI